jgi:transposase
VNDHLIAEANRHAKALHQMTIPTTKPNQRDIDWYIAECIDLRRQLEYEIEAKRNHLRIACEEINDLTVKAGFYEAEIARLRRVAMKLIVNNGGPLQSEEQAERDSVDDYVMIKLEDFEALCAAIDAARKEAQP